MRYMIAILISTVAVLSSPFAAAAGDAERGKALVAEQGCIACHGPDGNSVANPQWPKLAGQSVKYITSQLAAFKDNNVENLGRANAIMFPMAMKLDDQQVADLAAFFASQKTSPGEADASLVNAGEAIYRGGNMDKGIPACMGCHGPSGAGNEAAGYPNLGGQWAAYTELQLKAFQANQRRNDANGMMREIAAKMSEADMKAVASYIQGLH